MRKVLIVAFHFPPHAASSGFLRALKFCRYLPTNGWSPVVLTANRRAYERLDETQFDQIPPDVPVVRAFALDTRRHLSLRGRYLRWLALPDRWVTWCLGAVPAGLFAIYRHRVDVILTTFPIATTVLIGWFLQRLTGKPWVVDFRDSMTEEEYPRDPLTRGVYRRIERQAVRHSSRLVFTARSTIRMYLRRYPGLRPEKCVLIPNGYDEEDFLHLSCDGTGQPIADRPLRMVHSGLVYPEERDPRAFFRALARLKGEARVSATSLRIDLRAAGSEDYYAELLRELGIQDLVHLLPALPYRQALQDCADADGLLLLQAANCDHQVPAKAYEYLRLRKPILALTSETGDTAALLREVGGSTIVDLADEQAIYQGLPGFLESVRNGDHPLPDAQSAGRYSRKKQAEQLAECLSRVCHSGREA